MLSRVADSLYWMARYLERAEHTARLLDAQLDLMLDHSSGSEEERWRLILEGLSTPVPADVPFEAAPMLQFLVLDPKNSLSIVSSVTFARDNAKQLREHISPEMWGQLNRLYLRLGERSAAVTLSTDPHNLMRQVIESVSLFNGLSLSTISHGECWQFLQTGRYLERASAVPVLIGVYFKNFHDAKTPVMAGEDFMEWVGLLKSCAAFEAYCNHHTAEFRPKLIAQFLLLGREFPQAVAFAAEAVDRSLRRISELNEGRPREELQRLAGKLSSMLLYSEIDEILDGNLPVYLETIRNQCRFLNRGIHDAYVNFPLENALAS